MFKKIVVRGAIGLALLIAVLAVVVALQPSRFHVERSALMGVPPAEVFRNVNDLRNWQAWSPWAELDPDCKMTYGGPASGKDAVVDWSGNDEVGEGRMTILESRPHELIRIQLDFLKPWEDTATVEFKFVPERDGARTLVTWSMHGENDFLSKAFCLFMDMDQMIGNDYEKGLAKLKEVAEKQVLP